MVVEAPNSNGPFQPVALMHFRGTYGRLFSSCIVLGNEGTEGAVLPCSGAPPPVSPRSLLRDRVAVPAGRKAALLSRRGKNGDV